MFTAGLLSGVLVGVILSVGVLVGGYLLLKKFFTHL